MLVSKLLEAGTILKYYKNKKYLKYIEIYKKKKYILIIAAVSFVLKPENFINFYKDICVRKWDCIEKVSRWKLNRNCDFFKILCNFGPME